MFHYLSTGNRSSSIMSTFQFVKPSLSPSLVPKSSDIYSNFCFCVSRTRLFNSFRSKRLCSSVTTNIRLLKTCCKTGGSENRSNGDEAPESLFMKELRRRGMTPTSLLEETKIEEVEISSQQRDAAVPKNAQLNQREQSMALNSEGLEGLIPRATLLLTLGGTFFLAFRPLILLTVACFFALYLVTATPLQPNLLESVGSTSITGPAIISDFDNRLRQTSGAFGKQGNYEDDLGYMFSSFFSLVVDYASVASPRFFGSKFVHDGTDYDTTIPQYMDPYQLVERKE